MQDLNASGPTLVFRLGNKPNSLLGRETQVILLGKNYIFDDRLDDRQKINGRRLAWSIHIDILQIKTVSIIHVIKESGR